MDETANEGDEQDEDHGQLVDEEAHVDVEMPACTQV